MSMIIGSARSDENYRYSGGKRGDQRQSSTPDYSGEVSKQTFYVHRKGWYILRPKKVAHANAIAAAMSDACDNKNFGYSQSDRYSVFNYKKTKNAKINKPVNCDCSSLVRKCIYDGTGKDVGDFSTSNEASVLEGSGLFESRKPYTSGTILYDGDVLVTKSKGHTIIIIAGNKRSGGGDKPVKVNYTIGKKYTVQVNGLNMRKGPGVSYPVIATLKKGDKITCKQVKDEGSSTWIKNAAGWVCGYTSNKLYVK